MSAAPEDLAARLASGEDFGAIAMTMLDPAARETIKHCAAVMTFDAGMYERVLRPAPGPSLDELREARRVRPVAGRTDCYQLEPYLREGAWSAWWSDEQLPPGSITVPPALARYAGRLADDYRDTGQSLEELRAVLLADAGRARDLFLELYARADEAFDLARAQDVIDVLSAEDRTHVLPVELARLRNEHQMFVSARSMWATAFHQTARYLSREKPERALTGLLGRLDGRVLQIVAPGGAGKTMQLRWFVARHCLRQWPMVPCAWIDFDVADPLRAVRYPWLLLVELARQLDVQIPGAPFRELVRDYERYLPLLSQAPEPDLVKVDEGTAADAEDIAYRFCATLAEARPAGAPVVLLLDTMEEVILRPTDAHGFTAMLDRVRREVPAVRLVLSGRYDLARRLGGARQRFGRLRSVRIAEFSRAEARDYLTRVRGITRPDLVRAIVRKCDGLPFTLALFGDVAEQDPMLRVAEVEDSRDPALLYCIVRILERIDDDRLRWVLRYGVVPRQLTMDFLEYVIWPYLIQGIEGTGGDYPAADDRPPRPTQIFQQDQYPPPDPGQLRRLWDQLRRYASQSSWVSHAGERAFTFHVRLRAPLREMLRAQPVFERLHRDAVAYYEQRAGSEPGQWARWTRDAVYHWFQLDVTVAERAWRDAISHAWTAGRPDWAEDLAADLLSADYLDESAGDRDRGTISARLRYEAHLQVAQVNAEAARAVQEGLDGPRWKTAEQHIQRAVRLADAGVAADSLARLGILRASMELARGDEVAAQAHLDSLRADELSGRERRDLLLLEAESAALAGDAATDERYNQVFLASVELGDTSGAAQIAMDSAAAYLRFDQPLAALRWSQRARGLDLRLPVDDEERLAGTTSNALLELCQPRTALSPVLRDGVARFVPGEAGEAAAEALLALDRPIHALRVLLPNGENLPATESGSWRRALMCGRAYGMLLRLESATRVLEQCLRRRPGDQEGGALASELALVHLRRGGDWRQASYYLGPQEQYRVRSGSREWLDMQTTRMALQRAQDRPDAARETLSSIFAEFRAHGPTRRGVTKAAVHGLPVASEHERDELIQVLLDALDDAQFPVATRVGMLRDLRYCPTVEGARARTLLRLDREILQPWLEEHRGPGRTEEDDAWVDLAAVEILRLLGRPEQAKAMLDRAVTVLAGADPLIWWEWVRAADRIGAIQLGEAAPPPDLVARYLAYPAVAAGYLIDLTARRLPADPAERSQQRLNEAEILLGRAEKRKKRMHAWQSRLAEVRTRLDRLTVPAETGQLRSALPAQPTGSNLRPSDARPGERAAVLRASEVPWSGPLPDPALLEELRTSWMRWAAENGQVLARAIGPRLAEAGQPGQTDIRLVCDGPSTAALPWEMAAIDGVPVARHSAVRVVYRGGYRDCEAEEVRLLGLCLRRLGLLAADSGPAVRDALHEFQGAAGLRRTDWPDPSTWREIGRMLRGAGSRQLHVLLLQQDAERSIKGQRGIHGSSADPVAIYSTFGGVRVSVVQNPRNSIARDWMKYTKGPFDRPDVLHICAGLEISSRSPVLNFGKSEPSGALSAAGVSDLVQDATEDRPPLIVLDVVTPATGTERIRQLLLRNLFCDELVRLGYASTVLGTGLAPEEVRAIQLGQLVQSLVYEDNAADAWRRLVRPEVSVTSQVEMAIPEIGMALFSRLPPDAVMIPGA